MQRNKAVPFKAIMALVHQILHFFQMQDTETETQYGPAPIRVKAAAFNHTTRQTACMQHTVNSAKQAPTVTDVTVRI